MQKLVFLCLVFFSASPGTYCWVLYPHAWTYHHDNSPEAIFSKMEKSFEQKVAHLKYPTQADLNQAKNRICDRPFSQVFTNNDFYRNQTFCREVVARATNIAWDNYKVFAWGPLTPDRAQRAPVDASVALSALITFHLMGSPKKMSEAKQFVLKTLSKESPPPLELFPHLVTAFQLTEEWRFFDAATEIASSFRQNPKNILCNRWPIEAITFYAMKQGFKSLEEYEGSFKYCSASLNWYRQNIGVNLTESWMYYWSMVNLHRYSNFAFTPSLKYFNAWLTGVNRQWNIKSQSYLDPKLLINKSSEHEVDLEEIDELVYIGKKKEEMAGADCAWGATFLMAAQARRDSVLIGGRSRPPLIPWVDGQLLRTGQNITETCRRAVADEPNHLLKSKFTFSYDYSTFLAQNKNSAIKPHRLIKSSGTVDLLPQLALTYLTAYRTTRDEHYRDFAWQHFLALQDYILCKVDTGESNLPNFSALVEDNSSSLNSAQLALNFFGQTMRYLYLTFEADWAWPLSQYVFTSTGNPIKFLPKLE